MIRDRQRALIVGMAAIVVATLVEAAPAEAHHEALFGPQSSSTLSPDGFLTFQVFTRELGPSGERTRETTGVVSAGIRVTRRLPITISVTAPYSWIRQGGASNTGGEDVLLGVRYRHDLKGLQGRWNREGNFVTGMGAIELNNGTIDHDGWEGPAEAMGALLGSVERGPWSVMGYAVGRANVRDASGSKDGNTVFTGTGVAYTPNEDFASGRLVSYQMGLSWEHYARDRSSDGVVDSSGGSELFVHPAVAYSPGHNLLIFGIVSVPVWQEFRDRASQTRYRVGTGVIYGW
jgi:hypothetical protein